MKLKHLLLLGGVLAAAAYFQNKHRREQALGQARDLLDRMKRRADDLRHRAARRGERGFESAAETAREIGRDAGSRRENGIGIGPQGGPSGYR